MKRSIDTEIGRPGDVREKRWVGEAEEPSTGTSVAIRAMKKDRSERMPSAHPRPPATRSSAATCVFRRDLPRR